MNKKPIELRIIFMGTSAFSEKILEAFIENKYNIVAVFTQPDRKSNRENEVKMNPVKKFSLANKLSLFQPEKFDDAATNEIKNLKPDMIILAAYGRILPEKILQIPGFGGINVHASLLPELRWSSPIQNALLSGHKVTACTIIQMDSGFNTGDAFAAQ